jgi:ABC-type uncharacterized transport system involved in gliding motility auxiliary subunit
MKKVTDSSKYSGFLIYIIAVVLLNIAGITLFFRVDLTSSKVYSLSEASRDVAATLSEPLTVKVFFNSNLPSPYNNIERYLHDLLEEYAIAGGRYFNYQFHNLTSEEDEESRKNKGLARDYGVQPVQIQNIEQDEVKFQKAYMGMALIHGDIIETIPTITSTEGLEYKITSTIRKMNNKISALLRLKEKIEVKLILSSSLRVVGPYMNVTGLLEVPSRIENIVNKLNDKNYGKLSFSHHDPSINADDEREALRYKVIRLNWDEFKDRRGKTISADRGYAGIIIEHGEKFEGLELIEVIRLPLFGTQYQLTDLSGLEKSIDETIDSIIDINEGIGYLADHGTLSIAGLPPMLRQMQQQESLSNLNKLLSDEYSIKQVNLRESGIPDGLPFMIIAGAKENFTDYELYQIDQFIMKGKNLAVFMDSFHEVQLQNQRSMMGQSQRPVYMPVNTGLEKLLTHYGVNLKKSIVLDENCFKQRVPKAFGGGERKIYFAPIIKNEMINKEAEYLKNIKGLVMLTSSPVEVSDRKIKDSEIKATKLFSSSERSWEMKGRINLNPMFMNPPQDEGEFKSMAMAYVLEGSFPSYFADKTVPEKEEAKEDTDDEKEETGKKEAGVDMSKITGEGITVKKGKPAKIFLIGTSEIRKDNIIDDEGKTPNAQFVMNVMDYLNDREEFAVMRSKTQRFNPLREISPAARTTIKTANIAGLPVLVVIAGIIVWGRRTSRKRMIQKIFSK